MSSVPAPASVPFHIAELLSSVVDIISSHSPIPEASLIIHIDEQVPQQLLGDVERIRRALIIAVERALIQHPNLTVILSCALVRRNNEDVTVSFSIVQQFGESNPAHTPHFRNSTDRDGSTEMPDELSLKIAKRIIDQCDGRVFVQPPNQTTHEICFWLPVGLGATVIPHH